MYSSKYARQPAEAAPPSVPPPTNPEPEPPVAASQTQPIYSLDGVADEFAQTRPPDDLFDDDFTPIPEPQFVYDQTPPSQPAQQEPYQEPQQQSIHAHDLPRGVPRGPRGGRGARRAGAQSSVAPKLQESKEPADEIAAPSEDTKPTGDAPENAPTAPRKDGTAAVRGDRSLTGGNARTKLTEDELAAKLASMALKNKALTEAHEKAQADQEAYAEREKAAAVRRNQERKERQQMMGERERNRARKMQALGGREWDAGKQEEDFKPEGARSARRGAFGGVTDSRHATATSPADVAAVAEDFETSRRGGPGQRGRGRGNAGRGRGNGRPEQTTPAQPKQQSVPSSRDFPDLPAAPPVKSEGVAGKRDLQFPGQKKQSMPEGSSAVEGTAEGQTAEGQKKEDAAAAAPPPAKERDDSKGADQAKPKLATQQSWGLSPAADKRSWADQVDALSP